MDKASSAGRGNSEDKARSASGHKGKDDTKAPQSSNVTGKVKDDNKAPQQPSTSGHQVKDGNKAHQPSSTKDDNKAPQPPSTTGHPPAKGNGKPENKAPQPSSTKDDNKAPQPPSTKDDNKAPQPPSTSGHPPAKGKGKPENKAPQPSSTKDDNKAPQPPSTVDNTKTKEDSLPSLIKEILEDAMIKAGVKKITVEFLQSQIGHIAQQIQQRKVPQKPGANLNPLVVEINEYFSKRMTTLAPKPSLIAKVWPQKSPDVGQIRAMAIHLSDILGKLQLSYFAGLLIVGHVLRGFEGIKDTRVECLEVIKEINMLAEYVNNLNDKDKFSQSNKRMAGMIQESREVILHGSILCCTMLESSSISMFFNAKANKDELAKLKGEVVRAHNQLRDERSSETQKDAKYLADRKRVRWPRDMQDMMQDLYPHHAVGIEKDAKKVIAHLQLESETKRVAVIVHGIPGMGKTTLADAVFSTIFQQNYTSTNICKYSKIRLSEDKDLSLSPITTLQTIIRDDLVDDDDQRVAVIRTFDDGQRIIGNILKKKSVFLYIDNVLNEERLKQLLPLGSTLNQAKRLRLLITARDKGIANVLVHNMSCEFHEVLHSSPAQAEKILKQHMDTKELDEGLVKDIVQTSGGVPLLLSVIGQYIGAEGDKKRAWRIFTDDRESWSDEILDRLDIAYRHLPDYLKDPFLDICSFFDVGWYWEVVEDIVGDTILKKLQERGLFTKDRNSTVTIHDVILRIGLQRSKGSRIMDANEISLLDGKGIKGLWFTTDQGREPIPAKKLDQVARSLRILALQNLKVEGDYNKNFPELIYLDAGVNRLPSNVSAFKKLTYLSYSPQDPEDLNLSQMPSTMKRLKLKGKLYSDKFRSCSLRLHGLQNLRVLKLFEFKHLTILPGGFASLKCLRELRIIDCDGFEELPTDLGDLNEMSTLVISKCPKLRKLPESISKLSSLRWLYLSSCKKLEDLSKDFHRLPMLQYLELSSCPMLQGQCMDMIKAVKTLKVVDIRKSQKLLQKWQGLTDPPTTFSVKMK